MNIWKSFIYSHHLALNFMTKCYAVFAVIYLYVNPPWYSLQDSVVNIEYRRYPMISWRYSKRKTILYQETKINHRDINFLSENDESAIRMWRKNDQSMLFFFISMLISVSFRLFYCKKDHSLCHPFPPMYTKVLINSTKN